MSNTKVMQCIAKNNAEKCKMKKNVNHLKS